VRSHDVVVDVTEAAGLGAAATTMSTVHLPDRLDGPRTVLFAYPGAGYGRGYYDLPAPGYSQAAHHTAEGHVVVACDHLGVGASTVPDDPFDVTLERMAAVNAATAQTVVERMRAGTLVEGVEPIDVTTVVGMGQSMGGCVLTVHQANHATFDGVALLGWSGLATNFPARDGGRLIWSMPPRGTDLRAFLADAPELHGPTDDELRYCFHWPDEDPALMERDLVAYRPGTDMVRGDAATPWGSATIPLCTITLLNPGAVASEAAAIDVPVLVACGERDVLPDPWLEPSAYRSSRDVSVVVVERMAHMHNFARTRETLWRRTADFARAVSRAPRAPRPPRRTGARTGPRS
jgi:pimeloyl-ACP methyl ester carboxylesterase